MMVMLAYRTSCSMLRRSSSEPRPVCCRASNTRTPATCAEDHTNTSDVPCSVTTAFARLRSRLTTTISRATPRRMLDNRQAEPTAPAPITPIFIEETSGYTLALEHVMQSTIPYRTLGRTGESVSAIGLGGWHLGLEQVDQPLSLRIIRT